MEINYLNQKPGVQLIKAGTYQKKELNELLGIPALKSQIIDVRFVRTKMPYKWDTSRCNLQRILNSLIRI